VSLREHANREGEAMARAFEQSHAAYARKDGAAAKELSNEGKAHQREMERLNAEASAWIFSGEHQFFSFPLPLHFPHLVGACASMSHSISQRTIV
jgi:hypothetical protein